MLQTTTRPRLDAATPPTPIQTGPVYACFHCGQTAASLTPWPVDYRNYSPLDDWAEHIAYLRLTCGCQNVNRVARLGDVIIPLEFNNDEKQFPAWRALVDHNIAAVRSALAAIAAAVPPEKRLNDPPTRIVLELLAGLLPPDKAIAQLRGLMNGR